MKNWYIALCVSTSINCGIEIENKSSLPFKITNRVFEETDGLHKTPAPDFSTEIVAPYYRVSLGKRKMITELTGLHAGKTYTFTFSPGAENLIIISSDNTITVLGPRIASERGLDVKIPENYKPIAKL